MAVNREHDADHGAPGLEEGTNPGAEGALAAGDPRVFGRLRPVAGRPDSSVEEASGGEAESGTDGRSARAQARREQRRGLILAAATQVFKEKGYHATSVGDIIDGARIARGTFYLYFTSKREIFAALSAGFLAVIRGSVRKISLDPNEGEPLAQMRANFRRVIHTVLQHEDLATIVLRDDALDAEARAQLDLFYEQVIGLIGQAVRVGSRLGIARECDETIIAVSALGALKEILTRMLAGRRATSTAVPAPGAEASEPAAVTGGPDETAVASEVTPAPFADPDRLADELLRFFVRGVFTQDTR
ncbi:TetR/AcrR family transcriptional regulator [Nannocystis bainbridge]|uniref:Helix-turn-helix domain containing protein n=1 Tax=Nannocystis bainbridge TaxID=2995303 RepID=A0ABT5E146_9BACT|nr:TetR/AcrR family transcriptional regulator [Nannocystis bainbridge]MDC0719588.1 helix-turn-helix domain containing protein [Nannocystis bainbridge]